MSGALPTVVIYMILLCVISPIIHLNAAFSDSCQAYYNFERSETYLSYASEGITWTWATNEDTVCGKTGVLNLKPPPGAQTAEITFTFTPDSSSWLFNLGDSPTNNGQGGDGIGGSTDNAELEGHYKVLNIYGNDLAPELRHKLQDNAYNQWLTLRITQDGIAAFSDTQDFITFNRHLLQFDTADGWYLGINRVISEYNGYPSGSRTGNGLCSVCIKWLTDKDMTTSYTETPPLPGASAPPSSSSPSGLEQQIPQPASATSSPDVPDSIPDPPGPTQGPDETINDMNKERDDVTCVKDNCKVCYNFQSLPTGGYKAASAAGITWSYSPTESDADGPCTAKGVMKLLPPQWALGAEMTFAFDDDPTDWLLNVGDSTQNNGLGGDGGKSPFNAEFHLRSEELSVYENSHSGKTNILLYNNMTAYSRWLTVKLSNIGMSTFSDTHLNENLLSNYLFKFNPLDAIYIGINRVINVYNREWPDRSGSGLCGLCVSWNSNGDLKKPTSNEEKEIVDKLFQNNDNQNEIVEDANDNSNLKRPGCCNGLRGTAASSITNFNFLIAIFLPLATFMCL